jgi:phage shock protein E
MKKWITMFFNIKNISIISLVIVMLALFTSCTNAGTGSIADRSEIKKWITDGALIVDVRTPEEFSSGNYKGSINIPLGDMEKNLIRFGNKEQKIVVYCRTGNRSGKAKEILEKNGYKNILNGGGLVNMP